MTPAPSLQIDERPLHVCVAEALGWTKLAISGYVQFVGGTMVSDGREWRGRDAIRVDDPWHDSPVPRYDTDWSATGPLIEKYDINVFPASRTDGKTTAWAADLIWDPDDESGAEGKTPGCLPSDPGPEKGGQAVSDFDLDPERRLWLPGRRRFFLFGLAAGEWALLPQPTLEFLPLVRLEPDRLFIAAGRLPDPHFWYYYSATNEEICQSGHGPDCTSSRPLSR